MKFNFKNKLNSTFAKLIRSYLIIISIVIFLSSIAFYIEYKKTILSQASSNSLTLLQQANYHTNFNLNWSKSLLYSLYLDENINNLIYPIKNKDNLVGLNKLSNIKYLSPYIDSIYVYNKFSDAFYSSESNLGSQMNYEIAMRNILKNNKETFTTNFIPNKIKFSSDGKELHKNIFSIVLSNVKSSKDSLPHGAIILNINADELNKYFKQNYNVSKNIFAIDKSGQIILSSDSKNFLLNISNNDYIKKIVKSKDSKGTFITSVDGIPHVVTYMTSDDNNLKFVNIVPYKNLLNEINHSLRFLFLLAIFLILISLIPAYFISNKLYSPINNLMNKVKSNKNFNSDFKNSNYKNELEYLSAAIDQINNKPSYVDELSLEELVFIRKIALKDLLRNNINNSNSIKEDIAIFDKLNINIEKGTLNVLIFKIDFLQDFYKLYSSKDDRNLIRLSAKSIINDTLLSCFQSESLIEENLIISIISFDQSLSKDCIYPDLLETIGSIQKSIKDKFNMTVSVSIGDYVDNLINLHKSFDSAKKYLNYTLKYGPDSILYKDKIQLDICEEYTHSNRLENFVYENLKIGSIEKTNYALNNLFAQISKYSYDDMILSLANLFIKSEKVINDLYSIYNEDDTVNLKDSIDNLQNFYSISLVKDYLFNLYNEVIENLNLKKLNKTTTLINEVKDYINTSFCDAGLSIPTVADKFNISTNYLRSIFKNTTGVSLSKYINNLRFEKAKELLMESSLTINDIALTVGYSNTNYFYTAFKKMYGISPAQYRSANK